MATCVVVFAYDNYLADKRRNKKRKPRAMQGDDTARREDKEAEGEQEMESGDEEAAAAEDPVMEDEGIDHCLVLLVTFGAFFLNSDEVDNLTAALYISFHSLVAVFL